MSLDLLEDYKKNITPIIMHSRAGMPKYAIDKIVQMMTLKEHQYYNSGGIDDEYLLRKYIKIKYRDKKDGRIVTAYFAPYYPTGITAMLYQFGELVAFYTWDEVFTADEWQSYIEDHPWVPNFQTQIDLDNKKIPDSAPNFFTVESTGNVVLHLHDDCTAKSFEQHFVKIED